MFHISSLGTVIKCPHALDACDLAPHFETFVGAQVFSDRVLLGHVEPTAPVPVLGALTTLDVRADWRAYRASAAIRPSEDLSMFEPF